MRDRWICVFFCALSERFVAALGVWQYFSFHCFISHSYVGDIHWTAWPRRFPVCTFATIRHFKFIVFDDCERAQENEKMSKENSIMSHITTKTIFMDSRDTDWNNDKKKIHLTTLNLLRSQCMYVRWFRRRS